MFLLIKYCVSTDRSILKILIPSNKKNCWRLDFLYRINASLGYQLVEIQSCLYKQGEYLFIIITETISYTFNRVCV